MKEIPYNAEVRSRTQIAGEEKSFTQTVDGAELRGCMKILLKRRRVMFLTFLFIFGLGTYCTFSATPLYTASTTIKIEPQNPRVTGVTELLPAQAGNIASPYDYYKTQFALLESRGLISMVISDLGLGSDPQFNEVRILSANPLSRLISKISPIVQWFVKTQDAADHPSSMAADRQIPTVNATAQPGEWRLKADSSRRYASFLTVKPLKNTRLVEIQFTTPYPVLSQRLANAHASTFIRKTMEAGVHLTEDARKFLNDKNAELKKELERSEAALNHFRQAHGVVSLDKGENVVIERLIEINRALTAAKAQRIEAESLYRTIRSKDSQSLAQIMREGVVPDLKKNLAALEAERSKLSAVYRSEHPSMLEISQQISDARRALDMEIASVIRGIRAAYTSSVDKEKALQDEANKQQEKALNLKQLGVQYAVLEEEVKVNRGLYESILKRLNETHIANDITLSNMRIVDGAEMPTEPSSPNTARNMLAFAFLGALSAAALVLILEHFGSTLDTPENVWRAVQVATLGVVPAHSLAIGFVGGREVREQSVRSRLEEWHVRALKDWFNIKKMSEKRRSIIEESYRSIRTAFLFSQPESRPKVVVVTSPSAGEGKTATILNLGVALARDGYRVLIIDADLMRGSCHVRLGVESRNGLADVLSGRLNVQDAVQTTHIEQLYLVPAGSSSANDHEAIRTQLIGSILDELRNAFDFILIDSPPVVPVSDAAILSVVSDGVILVFHGSKTTPGAATQAMDRLRAVRASVLGVILNGVDLDHPEYVYYRQYYRIDRCARSVRGEINKQKASAKRCIIPGASQRHRFGGESDILPNSSNGTALLDDSHDGEGDVAKQQGIELFEEAHEVACSTETRKSEKSEAGDDGKTLPNSFLNELTVKLAEAVGPMAPLIVQDAILALGEAAEQFPRRRINELLSHVDEEILDPTLRKRFYQAVQEQVSMYCLGDVLVDESSNAETGPANISPRSTPV